MAVALVALLVLAVAGDAAMGHPRDGFLTPGLIACIFGGLAAQGIVVRKVWARATLGKEAGWVVRRESPVLYWALVGVYGLVAALCVHAALT